MGQVLGQGHDHSCNCANSVHFHAAALELSKKDIKMTETEKKTSTAYGMFIKGPI